MPPFHDADQVLAGIRGSKAVGRLRSEAVSALHALAHDGPLYYRAFFGELYFVLLVLAGLWFGLRGAVATSLGVTAFFLPFIWATWSPIPPHGLDHLLEILLFNAMALLLGVLPGREAAARERVRVREAQTLTAMGEAVAAEAHGGRLEVRNNPERGVTARVTLPLE